MHLSSAILVLAGQSLDLLLLFQLIDFFVTYRCIHFKIAVN